MLALAQKKSTTHIKKNSYGFSLVELLVVVAILAILAAIAIPLFLNQKQKAQMATASSDAHNLVLNAKAAADSYTSGAILPIQFLTDTMANYTGTKGNHTYVWRNCALNSSDQFIISDGNYIVEAAPNPSYAVSESTYSLYDSKTNTWRKGNGSSNGTGAYHNMVSITSPENVCWNNTGGSYGVTPYTLNMF